jgi:hypothetical protein
MNTFRVVSAAMLMDDGLIVPGVRHFSPDMRAVLKRIYGEGLKVDDTWLHKPYHLRVKEQGFVDSHGNFLSREEAWKRADALGQIFLYDPMGTGKLIPQPANQELEGTLFSENLY